MFSLKHTELVGDHKNTVLSASQLHWVSFTPFMMHNITRLHPVVLYWRKNICKVKTEVQKHMITLIYFKMSFTTSLCSSFLIIMWKEIMLRCKSKLCILRLKFGGNAPAVCTFIPVKVPKKTWSCWSGALFSVPFAVSTSACQLLSMCASSLKRPNRSLCQESLWQTRRVKTGQLQSESVRDIYQRWREGNTAEWQWNWHVSISITSLAPVSNWNDCKQPSVLIKTVGV